MRALFISNDPSVFVEGSPTRLRLGAYARLIGELHIVSRAPRFAKSLQEGALNLHPVHGGRIWFLLVGALRARSLIRRHEVEIVSAQDPFEHGFVAYRACKGTRAILHVQIHTDFLSRWFSRESLMNFIRVRVADFVLPRAAAIRTVSRRVADSVVLRYGNRAPEPSVLPIAVELRDEPPAALPVHEFSFVFVTASRLTKEKRIEDIVRALHMLERNQAGLMIVGEGSERARLVRLVRQLGLSRRVVFTGWREDLTGLLRSADAYVQASSYEGYGRSLIEAAWVGMPIVATDTGIVADVLNDKESALVVPPAHVEALAARMRELVDAGELRLRLGIRAREEARAHLAQFHDLPAMIRDDLARALSVASKPSS